MARTKRKNLAAITVQPDQGEPEAAAQVVDDDDENVEVRKQRVLIIIPSKPKPSNNNKSSSPPEPDPPPQIKALPAPRPRPRSSTTIHKQYLPPAPSKQQQQLKLLIAPRDNKIGSFKKKLQRIGGLGLWLRSQGLGQFARIFQEQQMDEADLLNLTMQALKDIGVAPVGPRRKLIWAIDQLCNG